MIDGLSLRMDDTAVVVTSPWPLTILYGHATDALRAADVALVASGTATLQAALARCPHIVFYRIHRLTEHISLQPLGRGPQCRTHADLPGSFPDGRGHDSIEADGGEQ